MGGNIYSFPQNRHYYDSLDSVEVIRAKDPYMMDTQDDNDDEFDDLKNKKLYKVENLDYKMKKLR